MRFVPSLLRPNLPTAKLNASAAESSCLVHKLWLSYLLWQVPHFPRVS
jgi:hypothetical protein